MFKSFLPSIALTALCVGLQSCNPDCESIAAGSITMQPEAILPGSEILVKATPSSGFLEGRKLFIDDPANPREKMEVETRFVPELDGVIAEIPDDAFGDTQLYVEDPDCSGNLITLQNALQIESQSFFDASDRFILPPIPIVIIPTIPPPPPANITNAWVSPYQRDYCIWFVPDTILVNGIPQQQKALRSWDPNDIAEGRFQGSRELIVGGCEGAENLNAHLNPVFGYVDKEKNEINITIDRSSKGLGFETLTGGFITPDQFLKLFPDWSFGGGLCDNPNTKFEAEHYMLLTSSLTGQQLLMVKVTSN